MYSPLEYTHPYLWRTSLQRLVKGPHNVLQADERAQDERQDAGNDEHNVPDQDILEGTELVRPQDAHLNDTRERDAEG